LINSASAGNRFGRIAITGGWLVMGHNGGGRETEMIAWALLAMDWAQD
jgi:hypothetical protein